MSICRVALWAGECERVDESLCANPGLLRGCGIGRGPLPTPLLFFVRVVYNVAAALADVFSVRASAGGVNVRGNVCVCVCVCVWMSGCVSFV